jgi:hypothetical protein
VLKGSAGATTELSATLANFRAGKTCEVKVYPDAPHGFTADYRPSYRPDDAKDAWARILAWFKDQARSPTSLFGQRDNTRSTQRSSRSPTGVLSGASGPSSTAGRAAMRSGRGGRYLLTGL